MVLPWLYFCPQTFLGYKLLADEANRKKHGLNSSTKKTKAKLLALENSSILLLS
jgi:hypothetical protein